MELDTTHHVINVLQNYSMNTCVSSVIYLWQKSAKCTNCHCTSPKLNGTLLKLKLAFNRLANIQKRLLANSGCWARLNENFITSVFTVFVYLRQILWINNEKFLIFVVWKQNRVQSSNCLSTTVVKFSNIRNTKVLFRWFLSSFILTKINKIRDSLA